ncbi:MAG: DUF4358 domain-containing protein, partial [Ruminococcus sp.]|nr:DUF4358 domain-containing protein [Ruminococcus sp.]
ILCAAMCAVMAISGAALTGCGDSGDSSGSGKSSSAKADTKLDAAAIADKLFNEIEYKDQLVELSEEKVEAVVGVSKDKFKVAKVYRGSGATAEEIDCFEASDEDAAKEIYDVLKTYLEDQKKRYADYAPGEMDKLEKAVVVQNGKYVFMSISDDDAKAKEIIG